MAHLWTISHETLITNQRELQPAGSRRRHIAIRNHSLSSAVAEVKGLQESEYGIAIEISSCLELAMLLEVSIYPKPGNVHRARDHSETTFEHFLASAVACRSHLERAAEKGLLIKSGKISSEQAQVGSLVRDATVSMIRSQHGCNTSLGTILLLMLITIAAGMTFTGRRLSQYWT